MLAVYGLPTLAVVGLLYALFRAATTPLKDIPGPFLARFTRLWFFRSVWNGHAHLDNIALHRKYAKNGYFAPIVRLGPNMYSISRPDKTVYGIGSKMPKTSWYEGWKHPSPERWTMFPDRNIQRHAETRRKFQSMYSMSSLLHYEEYVESSQDVFKTRLEEMVHDGRTVDFHHWLQCYAFDVIGNITYSRRFGFLDRGEDVENVLTSLHSIMSYSTLAGIYSWAHPILYKIMEKLPGSGAQGRNYIIQYTQRRIADREAERSSNEKAGNRHLPKAGAPRDFLDITMDAAQDPEKAMTPYHVFMASMSNIIAGSDTTAISLSSVLWHLTANAEPRTKLRHELDTAMQERKMSKDRISFKESQNLPYLQACIKEGLRLSSATGLPLWREVPAGSGGMEIMGRFFPEGSEVGINTWVAHYDEDIWGKDAAEFRPERWLDAEGETLKMMESFFMPFGLGSRTCIGRHISYLEMCKVVPMIVSQFDLEFVKVMNGECCCRKFDTVNYWFCKPVGFRVVVKARRTHT